MTDDEIDAGLRRLVADERATLAEFLSHLREFDEREVARKKAFGSTFVYCCKELGLSEDEAYKRIQVARAIRKHPEILERIRDGRLTFTAALRLSPHLGAEDGLLAWGEGKTSREIEKKTAELSEPEPRAPEIVRHVPAPAVDGQPRRAEVRYNFTVAERVHELFLRAKDLSRHRRPRGRIEELFEDSLLALLDVIDPVRKPPAKPRDVLPDRRRIPQFVKDAVWARDGGRCAFEAEGRRCEATAWLEFDHVTPFSLGGASDDPANIRLLCRAHNQLEGRRLTCRPAGK